MTKTTQPPETISDDEFANATAALMALKENCRRVNQAIEEQAKVKRDQCFDHFRQSFEGTTEGFVRARELHNSREQEIADERSRAIVENNAPYTKASRAFAVIFRDKLKSLPTCKIFMGSSECKGYILPNKAGRGDTLLVQSADFSDTRISPEFYTWDGRCFVNRDSPSRRYLAHVPFECIPKPTEPEASKAATPSHSPRPR